MHKPTIEACVVMSRNIEVGYRPHLLVDGGQLLGVEVVHVAADIPTGEQTGVLFELLYPGIDYAALHPGAEFAVVEGTRKTGSGLVLGTRQVA